MSLNNNIIVNESGTAANVENYKIVIIGTNMWVRPPFYPSTNMKLLKRDML